MYHHVASLDEVTAVHRSYAVMNASSLPDISCRTRRSFSAGMEVCARSATVCGRSYTDIKNEYERTSALRVVSAMQVSR